MRRKIKLLIMLTELKNVNPNHDNVVVNNLNKFNFFS
jgi:hypothetical protein